METYTFTHEQLFDLLMGVIDLRDEYQHSHGSTGVVARGKAVLDTLEGLDAERELMETGESLTPSQVIERTTSIIEDAKHAAKCAVVLQEFCDRPRGEGFDLLSVELSLFGKSPRVHIGKDVLEQISPKSEWGWARRNDDSMPFKASIELDGVVFFAILDRGEARNYGCPQEVLDAAVKEK
jgi:hypothetical protein